MASQAQTTALEEQRDIQAYRSVFTPFGFGGRPILIDR